ncbi:hypothetical protein ABPG74_014255 [Tetrahymena malaccensis]
MSIRQYDNNSVDYSQNQDNMNSLEDIDPSLQDGFQIVYDREVPLELRTIINNQQSQEVGSLESIKVKILIRPSQNQHHDAELSDQTIKIEFTSETDLFFFYIAIINYESFKQIKEENKLKMEYNQFLQQLIKLFNQCYKEPHNFFGIFEMEEEGRANLKLIENMEYKFLEILSLDFVACDEDLVKQNVIYRYNILKAKMLFVQSRLEDISNLIKLKNPSLLVQIQKNTLSGNFSASTMRSNANQSKYNPNNSRFLK